MRRWTLPSRFPERVVKLRESGNTADLLRKMPQRRTQAGEPARAPLRLAPPRPARLARAVYPRNMADGRERPLASPSEVARPRSAGAGGWTFGGGAALRPVAARPPHQRGRPSADPVQPRTALQRAVHVSELRFNELRGEQVDYAIHRQERTFLPTREHCPLCPTRPGGPATEIPFESFEIVVFENRFPAFEEPQRDGRGGGLHRRPRPLAGQPAGRARAEALMWVWRQRYEELGAREEIDYVYIFENRGVEVGVTLHHPHGQIYGYPFLPPVPALELAADARLDGCAVCRLNEAELARRTARDPRGRARRRVRPPRRPLALRSPRLHARAPSQPVRVRAARSWTRWRGRSSALVRGFDALFARPFPYVMAVHQEPTALPAQRLGGHLHVEFYPPLRTAEKLKYPAGSEQGAGTFISDVLPEESAAHLREAIAACRVERAPRLRPRAREPDRRAHRLQRRPRAPVRDRRRGSRSAPRHRRRPAPIATGDAARIEATAGDLGEHDEFAARGTRSRTAAGGRSCAASSASSAAGGWSFPLAAQPRDRRRPAAWRRAVLLGGARGGAVPGAASSSPREPRPRPSHRA